MPTKGLERVERNEMRVALSDMARTGFMRKLKELLSVPASSSSAY